VQDINEMALASHQRRFSSRIVLSIRTVKPARFETTVLEIYDQSRRGKGHFYQASRLNLSYRLELLSDRASHGFQKQKP
jgi:hypothetical protein